MGKCPERYENWTFCNMGHPRPLSTHILKSEWFYMFYTSEMFSHSHSLFEKWVVLHVYTSEMYCHSNSLFKKVGGFTCFPCVKVCATQFCTQSGWFYIKSKASAAFVWPLMVKATKQTESGCRQAICMPNLNKIGQ